VSSAAVSSEESSRSGESAAPVRVELLVQGMSCAACAAKVESRLNALDNVSATVNYAIEKATVTKPAWIPVQLLVDEIEQAGHSAEVASDGPADTDGAARDAARVAYLRPRLATIRRNLAWAFGYNIAAIPLAAAGLLNPVIAGAAMAASSAFVAGDSVRLNRFGAPASALRGWRRPGAAEPGQRSGGDTEAEEQAASCLE